MSVDTSVKQLADNVANMKVKSEYVEGDERMLDECKTREEKARMKAKVEQDSQIQQLGQIERKFANAAETGAAALAPPTNSSKRPWSSRRSRARNPSCGAAPSTRC